MNNKDTLLKRAKELEQAVELEKQRVMLGKNKNNTTGKTLLKKAQDLENKYLNDLEKQTDTLFHRFKIAEEKNKNNKDNILLY